MTAYSTVLLVNLCNTLPFETVKTTDQMHVTLTFHLEFAHHYFARSFNP